MPQARGTQTTTALFEETTYKETPATPAGQKLYLTANNIQAQQNLLASNTLTNTRERDRPAAGNINVTGSLDFELGAEWIGTLMKHLLGSNTTTGTDPYTHTMTLGDLPVGMVIEKDFGANILGGVGRYHYFNGCRCGGATFNFPQEGFPTGSIPIVGALETLANTPLDATLDDNGNTPFSAFDIAIEEGGFAIATVTDATITLNNGLDEGAFVIGGAGVRRALPEGFATITGSLTALFEDVSLLNKAIGGTESSLKLTASRGDGLGSAGNESMEFFVQQLLFERSSPAITGPGGIVQQLNFESYFGSGGDSALQLTLKNAVATI